MSTTIVPKDRVAKIAWYQTHNPVWLAAATSIGTTAALVNALITKTTAAQDAYDAHLLAQEQARAATNAFYTAVDAMAAAGSDILKQIKAKAATDPSVYDTALIPPPAIPTPVPPPGQPNNFSVELVGGALNLKWKCSNPSGSTGTMYQVYRKIGGVGAPGDFTLVGWSGVKSFSDTSLPAGAGNGVVSYKIIAVRSTTVGTPGEFNVTFGGGGIGESMTATVVQQPKLAA